MSKIIFADEYIQLEEEDQKVWMRQKKMGMTIMTFNNDVATTLPRLRITKFSALSAALRDGLTSTIEVGEWLPLVDIRMTNDGLIAEAIILMTPIEYETYDKEKLKGQMLLACKDANIIYGLNMALDYKNLMPLEKITVAEGRQPINGDDAKIRMYTIGEVVPKIVETGGVDHYELSVINRVNEGDWLGERLEPTPGIPGMTVTGQEIPPIPGHQEALVFDTNSVISVLNEEEGITTLYAKRNGAVVYTDNLISVQNAIRIDGDVGFATGNVDFDGFVEVNHTVDDNFTVIATENIQILGKMGIGAVSLIESRMGDIYVKGGIAGKHKAIIKAKKNIYTKFASDCTIICEGTVHIGFYAMNCDITAKEVILESPSSKIIGGVIRASVKVEASEIGGRAGIHTKIIVGGFDREKITQDYNMLSTAVELTKEKLDHYRKTYEAFGKREINQKDYKDYEEARHKYISYKKRLENLYETQKNYISYLLTKGLGEVVAKKRIYPNVLIKLLDKQILVKDKSNLPVRYYYEDHEIKVI
ncbi:MAG: FapA family protein [Vallitaleaceae bacterium]|nr:FapA family protein [Vallitaleaceae bacterium]